MIFHGKVSYWTLLRPKYSWALTGVDASSTAIGARAIDQRIRIRLMKTPRTCPPQKCRSELQSGEPPGSALARGARDVPPVSLKFAEAATIRYAVVRAPVLSSVE